MYHNFLIHSSVNVHLGCFPVLVIVNSATMNIGAHVSLSILASLGCTPNSGIAGSYGSFIPSFFFFFLRNLHFVLHSVYTSLPSHQQCKEGFSFPTPSPAFTVKLFDDGSDWYEMISNFGFDLHFSNKECIKAVYCHPAYLTYLQSTS